MHKPSKPRETRPLKVTCAICGARFIDEGGGRDVPLCSEDCEREHRLGAGEDVRREHDWETETAADYGGVLGADNQVHSDADPGL